MFVLVSTQDDGLLILPTHRLIGGLTTFSAAAFKDAIKADFEMTEVPVTAAQLPDVAANIAAGSPHTFGSIRCEGESDLHPEAQKRERASAAGARAKRMRGDGWMSRFCSVT